ncbi:MAG: hypothetical protein P8182_00305 [Deltaproteobacteria bacterium]
MKRPREQREVLDWIAYARGQVARNLFLGRPGGERAKEVHVGDGYRTNAFGQPVISPLGPSETRFHPFAAVCGSG